MSLDIFLKKKKIFFYLNKILENKNKYFFAKKI
jgi:hypothetical protein